MKLEVNEIRRIGRSGFTLVEMLLVVAIIGILATVVIVNFAGRGKQAAVNACRASITGIGVAIDTYETDTGRFPPSLQSLISNDGAPNWMGPYIKGGMPVDTWGTAFGYTIKDDRNYEVRSAGPDQQMSTGDDITGFITPQG